MDNGTMLHLLRNPWGHPEEDVRQARLAAADALEKWGRCVTHPASAVEWIAVMQADTAALRARVAELEALLIESEALLCDPQGGEAANEMASRIRTGLSAGGGQS